MSKVAVVIGWILAVLLGAIYALAGVTKLSGAAVEQFAGWGYSGWFSRLIGACELAGGVGLLFPKTTRFAAIGLAGIMLGAIYTHVANAEGMQVLSPIVFTTLLAVIYFVHGAPRKG